MDPQWLQWAKRLQAISQTGLYYGKDPYDIERFEEIQQIAAEMMAAGSEMEISNILGVFTEQTGYATPKVDVRGVCFRDEKILLVKERIDGGWTIPGGWADIGQSPKECVEREILEESGFIARAEKLAAVYDREKHQHTPRLPFHIYKCFFLCKIEGGEAKISYETLDVGFFGEDGIPPLSLSRTTPGQITRMFEYYRNPELPCDYD
jgi:ADP-ribose pyrophosphatase YjhB (NUDIX family)